jgi:hypothetical protein
MRWISAIGGAIATGAALLVLISLPTDAVIPEVAATPVVVEVAPAEQPVVIEQTATRDLPVPDLGEGIADVLAESGYTQFTSVDELSEVLPEDVVQVLIDEQAVLVIPSEEESDGS